VISFVRYIFYLVDRALPALLFATLLSLQGLVAAGAADSLAFPELTGPDGRVVTLADLCSSTPGSTGGGTGHCGGCTLSAGALPTPISAGGPFDGGKNSAELPFLHSIIINTPERWQYLRRGPPTT